MLRVPRLPHTRPRATIIWAVLVLVTPYRSLVQLLMLGQMLRGHNLDEPDEATRSYVHQRTICRRVNARPSSWSTPALTV
jgi:hypothetical protein